VSEEKINEKTNGLDEIFPPEDSEQQSGGAAADELKDVEPTLEEQLAAAREEAARNLDSFLRAQAELSNARKRFEKQQVMAYVNANAELVSKLLPVLDDFDRAIESVPDPIREDGWFAGIELVRRKFLGILDDLNVKEIQALGQPFDPYLHDALAQEPVDEYETGTVIRVMIKGYQLGDKVIRPALVTVAE
jgi:molecular chaperone GrpE